jgi:hypothetical protein
MLSQVLHVADQRADVVIEVRCGLLLLVEILADVLIRGVDAAQLVRQGRHLLLRAVVGARVAYL